MTNLEKAREKIASWRKSALKFVADNWPGIVLDKWQHDAIESLPGNNRVAMKACTGPGKAQPVNMLLNTPDGLRRWGDLKAGDSVFAPDGTQTIILHTFMQGIIPVFRVTFNDGSETECCREHLWKVRGRTERRHVKQRGGKWSDKKEALAISQRHWRTPADGWSVISLEQIITRNKSNDGKTRRQFEIPTQAAVILPRIDLSLDPYVLGAWLGDGCRKTSSASWMDAEIDNEVIERGYTTRRTNEGKNITIYGILKELRDLGLSELGSHERFIPPLYKQSSIQQRKDILAGLLDTDGYISTDNNISFDCTSRKLVADVAWLVRSLGGVAGRIREKQGSYKDKITGEKIICRTCYRVTLALPFNPFKVERKSKRWTLPQQRYLTRFIDKIEQIKDAESMCIQVAHESQCYLTNDFICTHNTMVLALGGWWRLSCFADKGEHPKGAALSITKDNLSDNLWPELSKWQSQSAFLSSAFEWHKERIQAKDHPETWFLSARSYAKDADVDAIGRALSGLHSKYPFILLDETGDMPVAVGRAAEQIFTGNPKDALIMQGGNPTSTSGLLYQVCNTLRGQWKIVTVTADPDDPNRTNRVSLEYAKEQIETHGRENPWVMATILGLFPPQGFNALLGIEEVEAAMRRHLQPDQFEWAGKVLGVDVARFGDDRTVIFPRQGLFAGMPTILRQARTTDIAAKCAMIKKELDSDAFFIDDTGHWGHGVIDNLHTARYNPLGVQFHGPATDPRYRNKRAEMWFAMADWVKSGGQLPPIPELVAEMTTPTYSFTNGKIILEDKDQVKKRLGRSPDLADALALTFAFPVAPKQTEREKLFQGSNYVNDYDPYAEGARA